MEVLMGLLEFLITGAVAGAVLAWVGVFNLIAGLFNIVFGAVFGRDDRGRNV
jgi:hypothetical protein